MTRGWASEWKGDEILVRMDRAAGRAAVGFGEAVAVETKRVTHVLYGTLRRSTHAAPAGRDHGRDASLAASADLPSTHEATRIPEGYAVEVGSWLDYACVEWVGRGHPGVTQGLEAARPRIYGIVNRAVREEGL